MKRKWALAALVVGGLALTGCSTQKLSDFSARKPELDLVRYFSGKTDAWGIFVDRFGTMRRTFKVEITGTPTADGIILDERFVYDDGELQQRVWTLKKIAADLYEGTAPDVIGIARGRIAGNALQWSYDVDLKVGENSTWRVKFDDWMWLQDDRVMMNRAAISRFGLEIGTVTIFFQHN